MTSAQHAVRLARVLRDRVEPAGSSRSAGGLTLTADVLVGAVVAALELGQLVTCRVNAHAARMAISVPSVPEFVKRIVSSEGTRSHEEPRDPDLHLGRGAEGRALAGLLAERLDHHRVRVARRSGRRVQHEVEVAVAVDVVDVVAIAVVREEGIGREVRGAARAPAGQDLLGLGLERPGLRGLRDVALDLTGDALSTSCRLSSGRSARSVRSVAPASKRIPRPPSPCKAPRSTIGGGPGILWIDGRADPAGAPRPRSSASRTGISGLYGARGRAIKRNPATVTRRGTTSPGWSNRRAPATSAPQMEKARRYLASS